MAAFDKGMEKIQRAFLQPMVKEELEVYFEILKDYSEDEWAEGLPRILRLPYQRIPSAGIMCKVLNEVRIKNRLAAEVERIRREKAMELKEREKNLSERKPLPREIKREIDKITGKWTTDNVINLPKRGFSRSGENGRKA